MTLAGIPSVAVQSSLLSRVGYWMLLILLSKILVTGKVALAGGARSASGRFSPHFGGSITAPDLISSFAVACIKLRHDKALDRDHRSVGGARPSELVG
jgi:hypothetical protein